MHPYLSQALVAEHMREARRQAASARLVAAARGNASTRTRVATGAHATGLAMVRWHARGA